MAQDYDAARAAREKAEREEEKLRVARRVMTLPVPTGDVAVRERLRQLGHPITLFGEREMERRDRLKYLLARLQEGDSEAVHRHEAKEESVKLSAVQKSTFFTEGSADLLRARLEIVYYSLPRARARIAAAKQKKSNPDEEEERHRKRKLKRVRNFSLDCSEIGDDRPLTGCSFSPDSRLLATCSRTGFAKLWNVPDMTNTGVMLRGHTERLTDVVFSPDGNTIATASADREAMLWDLQGNRKMTFRGHLDTLARIAFHPSGNYLGTACADKTWRLWDVNTGAEILLQEGHSRGLYGIAFQCDGSLVASCGMDALTRVWDLRTGRSVVALEGHVKPVLGVDFSPNGYQLATGSEDHTCKVWDMRRKPYLVYTIPAHASLVSKVKYEKNEGDYIVTASFDNTAKIWSAKDYKILKTLSGHEGKLSGLDLTVDGRYIGTAAQDRTIKLWSLSSAAEDDEDEEEQDEQQLAPMEMEMKSGELQEQAEALEGEDNMEIDAQKAEHPQGVS